MPQATIKLIMAGIAKGDSVSKACAAAGVGRSSFYEWLGQSSEVANQYASAVAAQVHSRYAKD
ncbi:hypothetical protein [Paraburkholderia sp. BL27I4N3]|uniref:terminase small subunit-like protein n=1 Tax=Paraburkholderia sp. BL27I4N3 TaxID=1938805 RepID=UPI0038572123